LLRQANTTTGAQEPWLHLRRHLTGPDKHDLLERLARDRDLTVISQYATAMGVLRFNHLHPPFDNVAVRRVLLGAVESGIARLTRTMIDDCETTLREGAGQCGE
jgi:hypothetical protein